MKFVYYRSLASCLGIKIEKFDDENLSQLKEKAERHFNSNELLKCEKQSLSMTDVFATIDSLKTPSTIVFHDWIKSDNAISTILSGEEKNISLQEPVSNQKYKGHALENQFYSFLTPYLFQLIETETAASLKKIDFEKLRYYLQFSNFIEESKKTALQQEVDREIRSLLLSVISESNDIKKSNDKRDNRDNTEKTALLASQELVNILNLLDKQFYALRVTYIDTVKRVLSAPYIEPSTFNALARAISRVELNSSHKSQVESFLQKGKEATYKKQRTTVLNKALLRNPLIYLGLVVLVILILLVFPFDFKNQEPPVNNKISGLDSLSQGEVKQTDSLLAFKEDSTLFETDDMVAPEVLPDFILSDNTSEVKNKVALKLYESMLSDYEIQKNNFPSKCDPLDGQNLTDFNYKGVENIEQQFTNHKFINESEADCYILYFENEKEGDIYGAFIPSGSSIRLKIVKNWRVIFYTGKEFTRFNPLKTSNNGYGNLEDAKKIDESFDAHFCEMDYVNFRVLSKIYGVVSTGKTTRLITDSNGGLEIHSKSIKAKK